MSRRRIAATSAKVGTLLAVALLGLTTSSRHAPAASPQEPGKEEPQEPSKAKPRPPERRPDPVEPPDGPLDSTFDLKEFTFSTDQAIALFEARVKKNPKDGGSYQYLGEMLERKAKETGDHSCYAKAEAALRKSLELIPDDARAEATLAAVLCNRHKFAEGLALSRKLNRREPRNLDVLATMSDALIELGQYPEGEATLQRLEELAPHPAVTARLANLAELKGDVDVAAKLMRDAAEAIRKAGSPKDEAWYVARQGDIALGAGRVDEAAAFYQAVPTGTDAIHDATFGLSRVRAAQGRIDEAIALNQKAVDIGADPHMLAALGDLYIQAGKPETARPHFERLVRENKDDPEHRRTLALFFADHDRDLATALELASADFAERKDIHACDALAWALFKNGRVEEASNAIAEALKLGTKDARIHLHAGLIYRGLGDATKANDHLEKALALRAQLTPLQADAAHAAMTRPEAK